MSDPTVPQVPVVRLLSLGEAARAGQGRLRRPDWTDRYLRIFMPRGHLGPWAWEYALGAEGEHEVLLLTREPEFSEGWAPVPDDVLVHPLDRPFGASVNVPLGVALSLVTGRRVASLGDVVEVATKMFGASPRAFEGMGTGVGWGLFRQLMGRSSALLLESCPKLGEVDLSTLPANGEAGGSDTQKPVTFLDSVASPANSVVSRSSLSWVAWYARRFGAFVTVDLRQ